MMDVRTLANQTIQNVNPNISGGWVRSTGGYTTNADGSRVPITSTTTVQMQVQGLNARDLAHIDGLNIQGVLRNVIMYGNVQGIVRADQQGGDVLTFPETPGGSARNWRVVSVTETWTTWSRVVVCLQNP